MTYWKVETFGTRPCFDSDGYTVEGPAKKCQYQIIENVYEWQEAIPVEGSDFTPEG